MTGIFSEILNMSLTGSVVIGLVLLARLALGRAPKVYSYALWAVVLFRLLCPVSLSAPVSVFQAAPAAVAEISSPETGEPVTTIRYVSFEAPAEPERAPSAAPVLRETEKTGLDWRQVAAWGWLAGMSLMALYALAVYWQLRRHLVGAMPWRGNAYLADHITSPFVLGLLRPRIYLPSDTPVKERHYILAHEMHHIRRGDHIIKLLAYTALCIHWFNPLVWAAFLAAGKDMEMSCDEAVIRKLGEHIRADYSTSLLRLATHRTVIAGTPLAFGEGDTKSRVRNMARWKRSKVWVSILCGVACIVVLVVCALNPEEKQDIGELTRQTNDGPTGCSYGDLCYTRPGGITSELREAGQTTGQETDNHFHVSWSLNGVEFGGIADYILPENTDIASDWVRLLDLPEWEMEYVGHFFSGGDGYYELEFFTDAPPEAQVKPMSRKHYFFRSDYGNRIYDMWFDMTVADNALVEQILSTARVRTDHVYHRTLDRDEAQTLGAFRLTIPKGCGYTRSESSLLEIHIPGKFGTENTIVAGVTIRPLPELALEADTMVEWVKATGISYDAQRDSFAVTDETEYGDLTASIDDLKDGKPVKDTMHYFYIHGSVVYDLWFDELYIKEKDQKAILNSVELLPVTEVSEAVTAIDISEELEKQQALESCRSVLQMVQNSESYKIETYRVNGAGALNPTSSFTEWGYGDNRLWFNRIPESGGESLFGCLIWDGVQYDCDSQAVWQKGNRMELSEPWLVSYQWNEEKVTYEGTLNDDEDTTVMLRINEENPAVADSDPQYFVSFRFTPDGKFRDVTVQCNLFQSDAMVETESIATLDPDTVWAEMNEEARRAAGEDIPQMPTEPAAEEMLRQCRAVLEAVQSQSCHLTVDQSTGNPASHWSTANYYSDGENWLKIVDIDPDTVNIVDGEQYTLRMAFLVYDGIRYSNDGNWGKAYTDIQWVKTQDFNSFNDTLKPWLASFQWSDAVTCFDIGTEKDSTNTVVMLRIEEPYPGLEDYTTGYFVNFFFNEQGSFVKLTVQADHFRGENMNYVRYTEYIVTTDAPTVAEKLQKECRRAVG